MLELARTSARVHAWLAPPGTLDGLAVESAFRSAPDELLLVVFGDATPQAPPEIALAVDQTSGYACWTLRGMDAEEAFARLSELDLPSSRPAFLQGSVAGVAAKVIAASDRIHILIGSMVGHHLPERVRAACADLDLRESNHAGSAA